MKKNVPNGRAHPKYWNCNYNYREVYLIDTILPNFFHGMVFLYFFKEVAGTWSVAGERAK